MYGFHEDSLDDELLDHDSQIQSARSKRATTDLEEESLELISQKTSPVISVSATPSPGSQSPYYSPSSSPPPTRIKKNNSDPQMISSTLPTQPVTPNLIQDESDITNKNHSDLKKIYSILQDLQGQNQQKSSKRVLYHNKKMESLGGLPAKNHAIPRTILKGLRQKQRNVYDKQRLVKMNQLNILLPTSNQILRKKQSKSKKPKLNL